MRRTYWEKRQKQLWKRQDKEEAKLNYKLSKEYKRMEKEIEQEMSYYYLTYGEDNIIDFRVMMEVLTETERNLIFMNYDQFAQRYPQYAYLQPVRNSIYKLNRLEGLQMDIWHQQMNIGAIEQEEFNKLLEKSYTMAYQSSMKGLPNKGIFFSVNSDAMKETLSGRWIDGKNYSDRIWSNKDKLARSLSTDLRNGIIRGDSYRDITRTIRRKTNVGINDSMRLVTTESAFVMNQANKQAFIDEGVEEYEITAILDKRTSDTCEKMNGQTYRFEDAKVGVNYPPFHPWCRTTVVPVEDDEIADAENNVSNDEDSGIIKINKPNNPTILSGMVITQLTIPDKQYGKKLGKHAQDYGLDPNNKDHRMKFNKIIEDIVNNNDEVRIGSWRGQEDEVIFFIKGENVVIMKKNGEFVSILKGGVNNARIKNARRE